MATNYVVSGAYRNKIILVRYNIASIMINTSKYIELAKWSVERYSILNDDTRKSMSSAMTRGIVGGLLFGNAGAMAGGLSAKNKTVYPIAVEFKDGNKSVIKIDDKVYTAFMNRMF